MRLFIFSFRGSHATAQRSKGRRGGYNHVPALLALLASYSSLRSLWLNPKSIVRSKWHRPCKSPPRSCLLRGSESTQHPLKKICANLRKFAVPLFQSRQKKKRHNNGTRCDALLEELCPATITSGVGTNTVVIWTVAFHVWVTSVSYSSPQHPCFGLVP